MTDDLVHWLRAQIAQDRQVAEAATPGPWTVDAEYRIRPGCLCLSCDEDEPYAWAIHEIDGQGKDCSPYLKQADAAHIASHNPTRVLAECSTKERVVQWLDATLNDADACDAIQSNCRLALRDMATAYADRPGYLKEWRT